MYRFLLQSVAQVERRCSLFTGLAYYLDSAANRATAFFLGDMIR